MDADKSGGLSYSEAQTGLACLVLHMQWRVRGMQGACRD